MAIARDDSRSGYRPFDLSLAGNLSSCLGVRREGERAEGDDAVQDAVATPSCYTHPMERAELLERVGSALASAEGVRVGFVFGSRLTARTRADSDLDIAVRYRAGASPEEREVTRRSISESLEVTLGALGERSDIVDLDEAGSSVAFRAIRDGVCVYEAKRGERTSAAARTFQRYSDDAPRRALFRAAARRAFESREPRG